MKESDDILIEKTRRGNLQAYECLINCYKSSVYTIVSRIVKNGQDAEEIAQDVFIKVWNSIRGFRSDSKFSTWLFRIAYNTSISHIRRKVYEQPILDDVGTEIGLVEMYSPSIDLLKTKEQLKYTKLAIECLSPEESAIVTMFYLNDCSVNEICDITNLTEANVKVKLFRARKKMFDKLNVLLKSEVLEIL